MDEQTARARILAAEDRLRTAMLRSDVKVLDELLDPGLIFTNHVGQLLSKEDDLAAHTSGMLNRKLGGARERRADICGAVHWRRPRRAPAFS